MGGEGGSGGRRPKIRRKPPRAFARRRGPGRRPYLRAVPAPPYVVVTGAAGFIGSALVTRLNRAGLHRLVLVDAFGRHGHDRNLEGKRHALLLERDAGSKGRTGGKPRAPHKRA